MPGKIFICNNAFQIMTSIILATQLGDSGSSDIIITNRAANLEEYYNNIKKLDFFRNVFFIETKDCNNKSNRWKYSLRQTRCEYFGCNVMDETILPWDYFDIYSINGTCLTNYICGKMQHYGTTPNLHLYEEGFGCYTQMYYEHLFNKNILRSVVKTTSSLFNNKQNTNKLINDLYLYEPDFIRWNCPVPIRKIHKPNVKEDSLLRRQLNAIYSYENDAEFYAEKFIFFEDCVFQDSGDNRDYDVILRICQIVGNSNFLLKMHPRTQGNRFETNGIKTIKKRGMPWEIVAMNMAEDAKHVFITVSSSSVVTYSLLFERNYTTVLLFKCLPGFSKNINQGILDFLEDYASKKPNTIFIPESIDEAYNLIKNKL